MSFTLRFLCGHFPWQPSFLQAKYTALFQLHVREGLCALFVTRVAVVQCEFIYPEEYTEGTQHLTWKFSIFTNSSIQVSLPETPRFYILRDTCLFHSYAHFALWFEWLIVFWQFSLTVLSVSFLLVFPALSTSWRFFLLPPSSMTEHLHDHISFHFIMLFIRGIQIFLVYSPVCLRVDDQHMLLLPESRTRTPDLNQKSSLNLYFVSWNRTQTLLRRP